MVLRGYTPLLFLALAAMSCNEQPRTRVGSKLDAESVTLGEMACQLVRQSGGGVSFRSRLGGTHVAWEALVSGQIDVYPEYTGTLSHEILAGSGAASEEDIGRELAARGILMTRPLGFNNTYAIGMREADARRLGIRTISDLRSHPELRFGFSNEFISRADGWAGLRDRYRLPQQNARGMEHALSYPALNDEAIDATDLYSTDAEIRQYNLRVLNDDLKYFPDYSALFVYRADWAKRFPAAAASLTRLDGKISEADMTQMNAKVKIDHAPAGEVADEFLGTLGFTGKGAIGQSSVAAQILERTKEHLWLVGTSLLAAIVVGLPLGVLAARFPLAGRVILSVVAVLYTIPGLALLVFLIPRLGIGSRPAIAALFLYSLLPIVRNTHAGLIGIAPSLRESAAALGLPARARLLRIELPLAAGAIVAGVKTAAVINIGTATLGALVGAGGYGEPILSGITLRDTGLMLQGAVPAAVMALAAQGLFELAERQLIPPALRRGS
jgi:osmoprotectant transport system permease protein